MTAVAVDAATAYAIDDAAVDEATVDAAGASMLNAAPIDAAPVAALAIEITKASEVSATNNNMVRLLLFICLIFNQPSDYSLTSFCSPHHL